MSNTQEFRITKNSYPAIDDSYLTIHISGDKEYVDSVYQHLKTLCEEAALKAIFTEKVSGEVK